MPGTAAVPLEAAVATANGRQGPRRRLESLCDASSFEPVRTSAVSRHPGSRGREGDGVLAGLATIDGRPVACFAQDSGFRGGSLGEAQAETITRLLRLAGRARVPVVGFIDSGGARIQEGTAALCGYARIFRQNSLLSGIVPQISLIDGVAAGGGCYSPALTDFVAMTERSTMFLTGPAVVGEVTGERIGSDELGGPRVHRANGVCDLVAADGSAAAALARRLLGYLPQHAGAELPRMAAAGPAAADPGATVPASDRRVYDVRDACAGIVDRGSLFEVGERWARNLLTAFARIEGRPVGVIANQPRHMGGVIDAEGAQKGARFVSRCDAYGLPLVVLVDTPGFLPGRGQEEAGVIRFGADLVRAFATAVVPRITVVLRKAFGGAFIAMNSRDLGADLVFAWPGAQIGVMSAQAATGIVHRREIEAAPHADLARRSLAAAYAAEHLSAEAAAAGGYVDEVIAPGATRARLVRALRMLRDGAG